MLNTPASGRDLISRILALLSRKSQLQIEWQMTSYSLRDKRHIPVINVSLQFLKVPSPSPTFARKLIQIYYVLIHFSFNAKRLLSFRRRKQSERKWTRRYCYRWLVIYLAYFAIRSHNAWGRNILRISIERNQFNLLHVHVHLAVDGSRKRRQRRKSEIEWEKLFRIYHNI